MAEKSVLELFERTVGANDHYLRTAKGSFDQAATIISEGEHSDVVSYLQVDRTPKELNDFASKYLALIEQGITEAGDDAIAVRSWDKAKQIGLEGMATWQAELELQAWEGLNMVPPESRVSVEELQRTKAIAERILEKMRSGELKQR